MPNAFHFIRSSLSLTSHSLQQTKEINISLNMQKHVSMADRIAEFSQVKETWILRCIYFRTCFVFILLFFIFLFQCCLFSCKITFIIIFCFLFRCHHRQKHRFYQSLCVCAFFFIRWFIAKHKIYIQKRKRHLFWVAVRTMTNDNLELLCYFFLCIAYLFIVILPSAWIDSGLCFFWHKYNKTESFVEPNGFGYRTIEKSVFKKTAAEISYFLFSSVLLVRPVNSIGKIFSIHSLFDRTTFVSIRIGSYVSWSFVKLEHLP